MALGGSYNDLYVRQYTDMIDHELQQDTVPIQGVASPTAADNASSVRNQIKELYSNKDFYSKLSMQSPAEVNQMNELYRKLSALESGR